MSIRLERVAELIRQEMTGLVEQELQDPALASVRVQEIWMSRDLKVAHIKVTHDDAAVEVDEVLRALKRARSYCRRELAARNLLRAVPHLNFIYNDTEREAARVHALLDELDLNAHGA